MRKPAGARRSPSGPAGARGSPHGRPGESTRPRWKTWEPAWDAAWLLAAVRGMPVEMPGGCRQVICVWSKCGWEVVCVCCYTNELGSPRHPAGSHEKTQQYPRGGGIPWDVPQDVRAREFPPAFAGNHGLSRDTSRGPVGSGGFPWQRTTIILVPHQLPRAPTRALAGTDGRLRGNPCEPMAARGKSHATPAKNKNNVNLGYLRVTTPTSHKRSRTRRFVVATDLISNPTVVSASKDVGFRSV